MLEKSCDNCEHDRMGDDTCCRCDDNYSEWQETTRGWYWVCLLCEHAANGSIGCGLTCSYGEDFAPIPAARDLARKRREELEANAAGGERDGRDR